MIYQSNFVGRLVVAPPATVETFDTQDIQLFNMITQQVATAPQLVMVNTDLEHSREHLVADCEEDLRCLRLDLRDGLDLKLAAHTISIGIARSQIFTRPDETDNFLERVETKIATAVSEIRHLICKLCPRAFDKLSLVPSIERFVASRNITIFAPTQLTRLIAALEVAACHIARDAFTNFIHKVLIQNCLVKVTLTDTIRLENSCNGKYSPSESRKVSIGLCSISELVEELDGTCIIYSQSLLCTRATVSFPKLGRTRLIRREKRQITLTYTFNIYCNIDSR